MIAVDKHVAAAVAQNGGDIDGGEKNPRWHRKSLGLLSRHTTRSTHGSSVNQCSRLTESMDYCVWWKQGARTIPTSRMGAASRSRSHQAE